MISQLGILPTVKASLAAKDAVTQKFGNWTGVRLQMVVSIYSGTSRGLLSLHLKQAIHGIYTPKCATLQTWHILVPC